MNKLKEFTIDLDKLLEACIETQFAITNHRINLDMIKEGLLKNPDFAKEIYQNKLTNCIKNLKELLGYEQR